MGILCATLAATPNMWLLCANIRQMCPFIRQIGSAVKTDVRVWRRGNQVRYFGSEAKYRADEGRIDDKCGHIVDNLASIQKEDEAFVAIVARFLWQVESFS